MIIGIPKEVKAMEHRVSMTPAGVESLRRSGHDMLVLTGAGADSGFQDAEYAAAGARIVATPEELWSSSQMVVKVKEPQAEEYVFFRDDLIIFTYLHLAADSRLTQALIESGINAVAYETIQSKDGSLPLLSPMSEIAGKMSVQIGAQLLEKHSNGKGVLLGGVPGVLPAKVTIVGGGMVGTNAAKIAVGMGADVTLLDININRLRQLDTEFSGRIKTVVSNPSSIAHAVAQADLLIGAVLLPGARAPVLVTDEMVRSMSAGSVIIDVAIDQGGSIETIDRITTHSNPTYEKYGVIHYSVANMPGAVPRTSTLSLSNSTVPYVHQLANKGFLKAVKTHEGLAYGVNITKGRVVSRPVAESLSLPYHSLDALLEEVSA